MKGDFTRRTFRPHQHYRGVLHQQGRVQLDADANEQVEIQAHLDEATTADTVGSHGGPVSGAGFAIVPGGKGPTVPSDQGPVITAGHYYVDGILCENEVAVPLGGQPDLPGVPLPDEDGVYLAHLDVWREHLTALERPELREKALGGPDTTTRSRTVWQVRLVPLPDRPGVDRALPWPPESPAGTGRLRARAEPPEEPEAELCVVPETGGYRRLENQLYRVEILDGEGPEPTFLWSRDNGTVVERLAELVEVDGAVRLTLASAGRDAHSGFPADEWVEVTDLDRTRRGEPGFVGRVDEADGPVLAVTDWHRARAPDPAALDPATRIVRRWDSKAGPAEVTEDTWLDLEGGIQVQFAPGGTYRTGDYWLIPARTASARADGAHLAGDVEWPQDPDGPVFEPRHGMIHHRAPLAVLERSGGEWTVVTDLRRLFPPLTEVTTPARTTTLVAVGGDGQSGEPHGTLPLPVAVQVRNDRGPVAGAAVRFRVEDGAVAESREGLGAGTTEVELETGADGRATCFWQVGGDEPPVQTLEAALAPGGSGVGAPEAHTFTATVRNVTTEPPGLHVVGVTVGDGVDLDQGAEADPGQLADGIAVSLDVPLGKPSYVQPRAVRITVDVPFPLTAGEAQEWGSDGPIGTRPVTLAGAVGGWANTITWQPEDGVTDFLAGVLSRLAERGLPDELTIHLWLSGRGDIGGAVRGPLPPVVPLHGLSLGGGLPTVDWAPAADFRWWFRLVGRIEKLAVVPTQDGLLRMKLMRDGLLLAEPTATLREAVPPGTRVLRTSEPDLEAAQAKMAEAFKRGRERPRPMVLVAAEPYAQAGAVLGHGIREVIGLELIVADHPGAVAAERVADGDPVDGVLTGSSGAAAVRELGGFREEFAL